MLTIKTYIAASKISGLGLMAGEFIAKGDTVWKFQDGFDTVISLEKFQLMPPIAQEYILHYGYCNEKEGGHILCGDSARYTNHSTTPNIRAVGELIAVAIEDINIGDEITEDYFNFDELAQSKLNTHGN